VAARDDATSAGLFVRGSLLQVDGLALADRLGLAESVALAACVHAGLFCPGGKWEALAELRRGEVLEMQRSYAVAARVFVDLEDALADQSWAGAIRLACCNHMISIGVHNCDPFLAEEGVQRGEKLRSEVKVADEVASWLQWRGIWEARRAQRDAAVATLAESFPLRAPTTRRTITRGFLEAEIAFTEEGPVTGVQKLEETVERARGAGLERHARAGAEHMSRHLR
jgi:hypothetical protein